MKIKYKAGYKYQLHEDCSCNVGICPDTDIRVPYITLDTGGKLTIEAGYAWDGPSGPTFDTRTFMRGSLVHDALYQLIRLGCIEPHHRKDADRILYEICRDDGMCSIRAEWVYQAVRAFGNACINPNGERKLLTAP